MSGYRKSAPRSRRLFGAVLEQQAAPVITTHLERRGGKRRAPCGANIRTGDATSSSERFVTCPACRRIARGGAR